MLTRVLFAIANLCHINYATDNVTVMRDTPNVWALEKFTGIRWGLE